MSSKVLADRAARSSGKETAAAGPKGFRHLAVGLVAVLLALAGSVGVFSASGSAQSAPGGCVTGEFVVVSDGLGARARLYSAVSGDGSLVVGISQASLSAPADLIAFRTNGSPAEVIAQGVSDTIVAVELNGDGSVLAFAFVPDGSPFPTVKVFEDTGSGLVEVETYPFASRPQLSVDGTKIAVLAQDPEGLNPSQGVLFERPTQTQILLPSLFGSLSGDGELFGYRATGPSEIRIRDIASGADVFAAPGSSVQLSDTGQIVLIKGSGADGLVVHDRDSDRNGVFDEVGTESETVLVVTGDDQVREGVTYSWSINQFEVSGDGSTASLVIETGDYNYDTFLESIDLQTYEVIATGLLAADDDPVDAIHLTTNGTTTVFALREPVTAGDVNGEVDVVAWNIGPCSDSFVLVDGIELTGTYTLIAPGAYNDQTAYGAEAQRYCASNVSLDPPYGIVCWHAEADRQTFISDIAANGPRPEGETIWFAETDPVTGLLQEPVKP